MKQNLMKESNESINKAVQYLEKKLVALKTETVYGITLTQEIFMLLKNFIRLNKDLFITLR